MRCQRIKASMIECSNMWPMCSDPVTLGGGMTSEKYGSPGDGSGWNKPCSTHHLAQCGSNRWGSYTFSIPMGKLILAVWTIATFSVRSTMSGLEHLLPTEK